MENWAEIRRLDRAEGLPIRQIARVMNVSRNTVRAAVGTVSKLRQSRWRDRPVLWRLDAALWWASSLLPQGTLSAKMRRSRCGTPLAVLAGFLCFGSD